MKRKKKLRRDKKHNPDAYDNSTYAKKKRRERERNKRSKDGTNTNIVP